MNADAVPQVILVDDMQEHFAITRHAANDMVRQIGHGHLAVNRRTTEARELFPSSLNDVVASHVNRAVDVATLQLQAETAFSDDVGLQQLQVAPRIFVVAFKITGAIAQITQ